MKGREIDPITGISSEPFREPPTNDHWCDAIGGRRVVAADECDFCGGSDDV